MRPTTALGSVVIAAVSTLGVLSVASPSAPPEVTAWEYKVESAPGISLSAKAEEVAAGIQQAQDTLNRLGQDGWELVEWEAPYAIFRRPAASGRR